MEPNRPPTARACLAALVAGFTLTSCAPPIALGTAPMRSQGTAMARRTASATLQGDSAIAVVRYFEFSPTVTVVGWDAGDPDFGLRAVVRRDGTLVDEHRLYVSTYYFPDYRDFLRADWHAFIDSMTVSRPLPFDGLTRDTYACDSPEGCSPYETLIARIPDRFLRASHDSLVVRIRGRDGNEAALTLRKEVIDRYLATVSNVVAAVAAR